MNIIWDNELEQAIIDALMYNSETGDLIRKKGKNAGKVIAPSFDKDGYKRTKVRDKTLKQHRIAFFLHNWRQADGQIDHIDQNKANNKAENLRELSHQLNQYNKVPQKNNKTGHSGIAIGKTKPNGDILYEVRVGSGSRKNKRGGQYIGSSYDLNIAIKMREEALRIRKLRGTNLLMKN